jgi:uncharacterized protein (TIGR00288 family)
MNVGLFIDGPNMLRKDVNIDIHKIMRKCNDYGNVVIKKIYFNKHATQGLINAMKRESLEIIITEYDVDMHMAIDASEAVFGGKIDVLILLTRDTDYLPLLVKAKKKGILTVVIGTGLGFSVALKHTADKVVFIR